MTLSIYMLWGEYYLVLDNFEIRLFLLFLLLPTYCREAIDILASHYWPVSHGYSNFSVNFDGREDQRQVLESLLQVFVLQEIPQT